MEEDITFRVLGPFEVVRRGQVVSMPGGRLRVLLASLVWATNQLVPNDQLIDHVWGDDLPERTHGTLQTYMARLRRLLGQGVIETAHRGYAVRAAPDSVDFLRFRRLVGLSQEAGLNGRPEDELSLLRDALALRRGKPFADVSANWLRHDVAPRLTEEYSRALMRRIDLDLAAGRHEELIPELRGLTAADPLREVTAQRLMVALHRSDRRAEAVQVYQRVRTMLRDELGLDPSPDMQTRYRSILTGDLGDSDDRVHTAAIPVADGSWVSQYQLPLDVADFVGRDALVGSLIGALASPRETPLIIAITGPPGIGKTALAVHVAHRLRNQFPDGQWFAGLAGAGAEPRDVPTVLVDLIHTSGVTSLPVRQEAGSLAAVFRARIADRRVLLVLDDAADVAQLQPLLPGTAGSAVIATSRSDLSGLRARYGARVVVLDGLTDEAARELLAAVAGADRLQAERPALDELVALCAGLPLALRIAAGNLAGGSGMPVSAYVRGLRDGDRLAQLAVDGDDHASVRNAFALSYRRLDNDSQRLFRLLGLVQGPDFGTDAAAAVLDRDVVEAGRLLRNLATAGLLNRSAVRYHFHDLLRLYARERLAEEETEPERVAALRRLLDSLLQGAHDAVRTLYPDDVPFARPPSAPHSAVVELVDPGAAVAWLDTELAGLVASTMDAGVHGPYDVAWRLADALRRHLYFGRHSVHWLAIAKAGLVAAQKVGDEFAEGAMRHGLGTCLWGMEDHHAAARELEQAIAIRRRIGDLDRLPASLNNFGMIHLELGSLDQAADNVLQALDLDRATGHHTGLLLISLSTILLESGRFEEATHHLEKALTQVRSRYAEAEALHELGVVDLRLGRPTEAIDKLTQARAYWIEVGSRHGETRARAQYTAALCALGQHDQALGEAQQTLATARETQNQRHVVSAHNALGLAYDGLGERSSALANFTTARAAAQRVNHLRGIIDALIGLAKTHHGGGNHDQANRHREEAAHLAKATGRWLPPVRSPRAR